MPVIEISSPLACPPQGLLQRLADEVCILLELPPNHAWVLWHHIAPECHFRPAWQGEPANPPPVVRILCRATYSDAQVGNLITLVAATIAQDVGCSLGEVFVAVSRVTPGHLFARGALWEA